MKTPLPPSSAESWFRKHILWPDETLFWSGRPDIFRSLFFNFWFCPVGAFLTVLLIMFLWTTETVGDIRLPEAVFALGSLWLLLSPLRYGWRAYRTAYFVTDKRAIILRKGLFRVHETAFFADDITDFRLKRFDRARGDIRLRFSKAKAPNPYQEDKEKWAPGSSGSIISWSGSAPFLMYNDGFWGAEDITAAADALKKLTAKSRS
ncbi:hypothetical protein [Sneathiella litorea]|uniref:PH domain-containing protein n=1 Tax=Sneathiella litorea TaxID=2606216 RepID=A0A6L8W5W1_9PROT|nr:hypothetical protein [Sneathiella litorea]MZR29873.1 hypothetical protein [Sneathiella litorea]